jgi:beta-phosphoglucomutase-like phosphatase (HAD superfamily)
MAGDDVSEKKPNPMIYNKAQEIVGVDASRCIVIEDSLVGLRAAKAAGTSCGPYNHTITTTITTANTQSLQSLQQPL